MLTVALIELRFEQVRPVVRPLFATPSFNEKTVAGMAGVAEGGAAAMPVGLAAPRSRIAPVVSTAPVTICAIAASTFGVGLWLGLGATFAHSLRLATSVAAAQLLSTSPGCVIGSPTV